MKYEHFFSNGGGCMTRPASRSRGWRESADARIVEEHGEVGGEELVGGGNLAHAPKYVHRNTARLVDCGDCHGDRRKVGK
jgi:hypothetical protein